MVPGCRLSVRVSIHAPRGRSDPTSLLLCLRHGCFNPRSPWEERPRRSTTPRATCPMFQSTLPVGGATARGWYGVIPRRVSIHAPRGRSDSSGEMVCRSTMQRKFQSTLPVGGATPPRRALRSAPSGFNPRSPWEERQNQKHGGGGSKRFNPRSPWEERHTGTTCYTILPFQSTLPVGGATTQKNLHKIPQTFQSTLPVGGATVRWRSGGRKVTVSIHAPRGRSDGPIWSAASTRNVFQSTLPVGGATGRSGPRPLPAMCFNPRSPWEERQSLAWLCLCQDGRVSIHAPRGRSDRVS